MWEPEELNEAMDWHTWDYTNRDRHFWPAEDSVPLDAKFIIDIGCNAGFTTGILADTWKEAFVLGIEMNPETAERARLNLKSFGDRVKIITQAVGFPERIEAAGYCKSSAIDHLRPYTNERDVFVTIDVEVKSLDTILREENLSDRQIDFIKMDAEGSEWEILNDGGEWSKRTFSMCLEIHYIEHEDASKVIKKLGFKETRNKKQYLCAVR